MQERTNAPMPPNPMRRGPGGGGFGGRRMGMPVEKAKDFKGTLRRLLRYFRPHRLRLTIVALAAILSTIFSIISPKLIGNVTTLLFTGVRARIQHGAGVGINFSAVLHIVIELVVLYILSSLFTYLEQYMMAGLAQRTVFTLRTEANEKLARLPLHYFDTNPHGDILSRFVNDFDNISNTLQQTVTQVITSVITFVGVIVMMLSISPLMTLVIVCTIPLTIVAIRVITKRSQRYFKDQQRSLGELNGHVEEMYTGHTVVKAFGREQQAMEKFEQSNEALYESGWRAQFISGLIMPMMNFIGNIGYVLVCVIGAVLVTRGAIQIGDIQAFIQYARQFSQPLQQLSSIANIIQSTIASAERVFELLDEPEEVSPDTFNETNLTIAGEVDFDHVVFGYQPNIPVISGLNIHVSPGQTVAIVGPTGAGKTTLVNLLMRFYELEGGAIRVDGQDIRTMDRSQLRALFGMVLQDTWLFHGTIRENIAYGKAGATEAEIIAAARAAYADHFIRTLPQGYDTVLNEETTNLSQGQKQLLTIARAILSDPRIMILDEATSSVDTRTEVQIQLAMQRLLEGRTSFVIAHRLSTIRGADLILVMNHGQVVEQGTHEDLLAKGGFYAELYHSQFETADTPA